MNNRLERLKVLAEERPKDAFTLFALAKEYERMGDLQKSRSVFENLVENIPDYVGVYFHLGQLLEEMEKETDALNAYEQGILVAKQAGDNHALAELSNAAQNLKLQL